MYQIGEADYHYQGLAQAPLHGLDLLIQERLFPLQQRPVLSLYFVRIKEAQARVEASSPFLTQMEPQFAKYPMTQFGTA